jgi:hypothetical protein
MNKIMVLSIVLSLMSLKLSFAEGEMSEQELVSIQAGIACDSNNKNIEQPNDEGAKKTNSTAKTVK